jgi:hypothetical protein|tara:strand:+ start:2926 stop:3132 length:207 start_codon:yes stop_codon:yes gene_type:complete
MLKKFFKFLTTVSVYNRTFRELSSLSDKELNDIGLHRGDIPRVAIETQRYADSKASFKNKHHLFEVHP